MHPLSAPPAANTSRSTATAGATAAAAAAAAEATATAIPGTQLGCSMRGHLHALSSPPFPHWTLRYYEVDAQSSTLKQWHNEAASTREAPIRSDPIYLVDSTTIEAPPTNSTFAARLVLTLCKGTRQQTTISFAHEATDGLYVLQAAILRLAGTVPATRAALEQSSALRLAAQGPTM